MAKTATKYLVIPKPNMVVQKSKMEDVINKWLALGVKERSAENLKTDCVHERNGWLGELQWTNN